MAQIIDTVISTIFTAFALPKPKVINALPVDTETWANEIIKNRG